MFSIFIKLKKSFPHSDLNYISYWQSFSPHIQISLTIICRYLIILSWSVCLIIVIVVIKFLILPLCWAISLYKWLLKVIDFLQDNISFLITMPLFQWHQITLIHYWLLLLWWVHFISYWCIILWHSLCIVMNITMVFSHWFEVIDTVDSLCLPICTKWQVIIVIICVVIYSVNSRSLLLFTYIILSIICWFIVIIHTICTVRWHHSTILTRQATDWLNFWVIFLILLWLCINLPNLI